MAIIDFTRLISMKQWFDNTNTLGQKVGDLAGLNTDLGNNLTGGVNLIKSDLGDLSTIDATLRPGSESLVESMNNLKGEIDTFRISEAEPQAYDMHPMASFGDVTDFDAHGFVE